MLCGLDFHTVMTVRSGRLRGQKVVDFDTIRNGLDRLFCLITDISNRFDLSIRIGAKGRVGSVWRLPRGLASMTEAGGNLCGNIPGAGRVAPAGR